MNLGDSKRERDARGVTKRPVTNFIIEIFSGACYNERFYNERIRQRTVVINKTRMLQRTQFLQRTRRDTIGRRSMCVRMMCRAFPL
jgi:hypothetical protein